MKLAYLKEKLTPADVKRSLSKEMFTKVNQADGIMCQCRTVLDGGGVDMNKLEVTTCLGFLDINIVANILGIKLPGERTYKTPEGIAHDFVKVMSQISGVPLESPFSAWEEVLETPMNDSGASSSSTTMIREITKSGSIQNTEALLNDAGFKVGDHVKRKDGTTGQIKDIVDSTVRLQMDASLVAKISLQSFVTGEWAKYVPKQDPVVLDSEALLAHSPLDQEEWKIFQGIARLSVELNSLETKFKGEMMDRLKLRIRPNRCIEVTTGIADKKLHLVPVTTNIKYLTKPPEKDGIHAMVSGLPQPFHLVPQMTFPKDGKAGFIPLFWAVGTTPKEEESNMKVVTYKGNGVEIPYMVNSRAIKDGEKLFRFVAKKVPLVEALQFSPNKRKRATGKQSEHPSK